jgi:hypothetical protein
MQINLENTVQFYQTFSKCNSAHNFALYKNKIVLKLTTFTCHLKYEVFNEVEILIVTF